MYEPTVVEHKDLGQIVFDWRSRHDPRSLRFLIADHFHTGLKLKTRHWTVDKLLNQGQVPGCTGWSLTQIMCTTPKSWYTTLTDREALVRYQRAQECDEWPGNDYEGSSVLGACDSAKADGWLTAYYWATTLDEIKHGLAQYGPIQIGSIWKSGMMDPDADNYIRATGYDVGGHAYEVSAYDVSTNSFTITNTWGPQWGVQGAVQIIADDLGSLVFDGSGEAALPRKHSVTQV